MKRPAHLSTRLSTRLSTLSLLAALLWPAPSLAAVRVGQHDQFTRLVFDLPAHSSAQAAYDGGTLTVQLSVTPRAERGKVDAPGVRSYAVSGKTVTVGLESASQRAHVAVVGSSGDQPERLVIDVPLVAGTSGAQTRPAANPPAVKAAARALTVVLDAGHGGVDPGMQSRWVTEKDVTLDVALRVRGYLNQRGVQVIMVRARDTQLAMQKRADLEARSRLAHANTVNAYISIHVNSGDSSASGIETYYFGQTLDSSNRSLAVRENGGGSVGQELTRQARGTAQSLVGDLLAQAKLSFSAQLARSVQGQLIDMTGAADRGVKSDSLYVIRNPTVPAILTEVGFGSSPSEGPKLAQARYRDRLAQAIASGILKFLKVR